MSFVRQQVKIVAVSFFGTLVDETRGLREALVGILGPARVRVDLDEMAAAWRAELDVRFRGPYSDFPHHLLEALRTVCGRFEQDCGDHDENDVDDWVQRLPFVEDHYALARLGQRYKFSVLAQLDRISLSTCLPGMARQPEFLVTSDLSRAYKPDPGYFRLLRAQLRLREPEHLLVVSTNREVDLEPAEAQGHQTLWIDRSGESDNPATLTEAVQRLA